MFRPPIPIDPARGRGVVKPPTLPIPPRPAPMSTTGPPGQPPPRGGTGPFFPGGGRGFPPQRQAVPPTAARPVAPPPTREDRMTMQARETRQREIDKRRRMRERQHEGGGLQREAVREPQREDRSRQRERKGAATQADVLGGGY